MTDTRIESWLTERRSIHAAATEGPWEVGEVINWGDENDVPQVPVLSNNRAITWDDHGGEVFKPEDGTAIVDAHNVTVPTALSAIEAVLAVLDDPGGPDSWSHTFQGRHSVFADDVRDAITKALEGVIDGE